MTMGHTKIALLISLGTILSLSMAAQQNVPALPTKELFEQKVMHDGDKPYLSLEPDSLPGDAALNARCTALWPSLMYLFENYATTATYIWKLGKMLPDTATIHARVDSSFTADTAFTTLYQRAVARERVSPISIDSALNIASHFFYLHSEKGEPVVHICVGINKVKELSAALAHPYHAAFCYQVIWEMEDYSALLNAVKAPYSKEFKKRKPSEARILEVEPLIYAGMADQPELRRALIACYERNKGHLNFELVY
ncbi:MAG: hypothetical protein IPH05_06175 [Flavobacteriales bacterium]|jgi:hypothetical protein|nr:hypothetical protein [Flavobacteriales bacterium]MBK7111971.1 hypothetical protein [Flavobacteriales bacterium]HQW05419.1 hypothetical protein [Flavobacteriales bacterium]HQW98564.1 hypothetical protein [Flavobacteriales bacterium]HQY00469.1 hypothetical protein [Flavobacteriales bacterium]